MNKTLRNIIILLFVAIVFLILLLVLGKVKEDYRHSKIQRLEREWKLGSEEARYELLRLIGKRKLAKQLMEEAKREKEEEKQRAKEKARLAREEEIKEKKREAKKKHIQEEDDRIHTKGSIEELLKRGKCYMDYEGHSELIFGRKTTGFDEWHEIISYGEFLDKQKAIRFFQKASEKGSTDAERLLVGIYSKKENYQEVAKWLAKLSEKGEVEADITLGNIYYYGSNNYYSYSYKQ